MIGQGSIIRRTDGAGIGAASCTRNEYPPPAERMLSIRNTTDTDLDDVLHIHRVAFGQDEEADLVNDLFNDESARPFHSLLAIDDGKVVGHILFTRVQIGGNEDTLSAVILAPMAVLPGAQGKGVGGKLIPVEHAVAWMVMELRPGVIGNFGGRIICADALNMPELWRE